MRESIFEKISIEKIIIFIIIIAIFLVFIIFFYLFYGYSAKTVDITYPLGRETFEIGETYTITWSSRGVDRVGIALFSGERATWIAENVPASAGRYDWKIQSGHEHGSDFWIAVFEYPWRERNEASYSAEPFTITYPELSNCDFLSIRNQWPFLAIDTPETRRVFITNEKYAGNLGGLDKADEKCQMAAERQEYDGNWMAFIGGENPEETAIKRLELTPRGLDGVFVEAGSEALLLRGATCHRLLGNNFNELLKRFSEKEIVNKKVLSDDFIAKLREVWLGRINDNSIRNCAYLDIAFGRLEEKYSYTVTCQNWTQEGNYIANYRQWEALDDSFPSCYTPTGEFTYVVGLAGLSTDLRGERNDGIFYSNIGKRCSEKQRLLCIEK